MSDAAFFPVESLIAAPIASAEVKDGHSLLRWMTALCLAGYGLVSFLPGLFGVEGRTFTVPFRALVLIMSLACLWIYRKRFIATNCLRFFLAFWTIYTGRILLDTILNPIPLVLPVGDYWLNAYGIGVIPGIAFCILGTESDYAFLRRFLTVTWAAVSALSLAFGDWSLGGSGRLTGNDYLNPISNGHIAAGLLLLCIYYLFGKKKTFLGMVFTLCCIPLGFFTLLAANSRGPIICAVVAAGILVFVGFRGRTRFAVMVLGLVLYAAFPNVIAQLQDQGEGQTISDRMGNLGDEGSLKDEARYLTYAAAWAGYIDNPVFGYRFELPSSLIASGEGAYPHNILLESLMSTGTVGTILLVGLLGLSVRSAWRLLRDQRPNSWVSLLFIQYFVGAMFSGGIYNDAELWHCCLAVTTLDAFFSRQTPKLS